MFYLPTLFAHIRRIRYTFAGFATSLGLFSEIAHTRQDSLQFTLLHFVLAFFHRRILPFTFIQIVLISPPNTYPAHYCTNFSWFFFKCVHFLEKSGAKSNWASPRPQMRIVRWGFAPLFVSSLFFFFVESDSGFALSSANKFASSSLSRCPLRGGSFVPHEPPLIGANGWLLRKLSKRCLRQHNVTTFLILFNVGVDHVMLRSFVPQLRNMEVPSEQVASQRVLVTSRQFVPHWRDVTRRCFDVCVSSSVGALITSLFGHLPPHGPPLKLALIRFAHNRFALGVSIFIFLIDVSWLAGEARCKTTFYVENKAFLRKATRLRSNRPSAVKSSNLKGSYGPNTAC